MELSDWLVAILKCALWDEKCYEEYPSSITCAFLDACTVLCKPSMSSSSIIHHPYMYMYLTMLEPSPFAVPPVDRHMSSKED